MTALKVALRRPDALDGTVKHPRAELPAAWLPVMVCEELVVHGWDIAHAADGDTGIDEDLPAWLLPSLEKIVPPFRSAGVFSTSPVGPRPGATAGERLLHLTGRSRD